MASRRDDDQRQRQYGTGPQPIEFNSNGIL